MGIFLFPFALADLIGALLLVYPGVFGRLAFYIGLILLVKGAVSFLGSFLTGFFFEFMGALDIIAGICILLGWKVPILWVLLLIKGLWSFVFVFA